MSSKGPVFVYASEYMRVHWDNASSCLEMEVLKVCSGSQYRASFEKILQLVAERKARYVLVDGSRADNIAGDDLLWTGMDWVPRFSQAGGRSVIIVAPKSLGPLLALEKASQKIPTSTTDQTRVIMLADLESARAWIAQQE